MRSDDIWPYRGMRFAFLVPGFCAWILDTTSLTTSSDGTMTSWLPSVESEATVEGTSGRVRLLTHRPVHTGGRGATLLRGLLGIEGWVESYVSKKVVLLCFWLCSFLFVRCVSLFGLGGF